jgi:ketosteroid isomerase-like protein
MSKENVDTVRRCVEAWNRSDVDAFVESFHPEGEWFSEIVGRVEGTEAIYRGREAIRRFWDEYHSVWDLSVQISEYRDLGEKVLALGRMQTRGQASAVELESPVCLRG